MIISSFRRGIARLGGRRRNMSSCCVIRRRIGFRSASIRPSFGLAAGFPERRMLKIDDYFYSNGNFRGNQGYAGSLIGYEPCGDYVVKITGEKFNRNWRGREGAMNNFISVRLENDFKIVYPGWGDDGYGVGGGIALTNEWMYAPNRIDLDDADCPQYFATRIDAFPDMKAKKTRLDIFLQAPDQPPLEYPLIKAMDYSVCNETVLGNQTAIIHWQQREIDEGS